MPKSAPSLKPKTAAGPRAKSGAKSGGKSGAKSRAGGKAGGGGAAPLRDAEGSKAAKRAGRHLKVGTEASTLATRLLVARLAGRGGAGDGEALSAALGSLKGPLMKIAQILATVPDALPPEHVAALRELQSNAPPMGPWFVKRRMQAELGADWRSRFEAFEEAPAAAASLGQVHRAEAGGRLLACKLQYPDMASAVEADLAQLRLAFSLYQRWDKAIDAGDVHEELSVRLREELDYEREARNLTLYRALLAGEEGVRLPEPVPELSTGRLLAMTWLEGRPLAGYLAGDPPQAERNQLAERLFRAWYLPFYRAGVIHGDPHLGNYTFSPRADLDGAGAGEGDAPVLNLLDFGCIRVFPPRFVQGVVDLYYATRDSKRDLAIHAYEAWGFQGVADRPELLEALDIWARFIYGPLIEDRVQPIVAGQKVGEAGAGTAAKVHRAIRAAGGVRPPREFVLMDRSAIGLASVFGHLGAEVNWHRVFHSLADDFQAPALARRQEQALAGAGLAAGDIA